MAFVRQRLSASRVIMAIFALTIAVVVAPGSAKAGCQTPHVVSVSAEHREKVLHQLSMLGANSNEDLPGAPTKKLPCSGPSCSERKEGAPSPLPATAPSHVESFCCTSSVPPSIAPPAPSGRVRSFSTSHPTHLAVGRDRPPR